MCLAGDQASSGVVKIIGERGGSSPPAAASISENGGRILGDGIRSPVGGGGSGGGGSGG